MSAFDGLRVLELGQVYLGPYCGLLFAQMGAEVIKVEPPGGEPVRFRSHDPIESHKFVMLNSNKRSVMLDLETAGPTSSSSPHSVRSSTPAPGTRAATRISASGYTTVRHGSGSNRPSPSTSSGACSPKHATSRSRATSSPTSARSTSSSEDCSEPAPPQRYAWTHRQKRSANGYARGAPGCPDHL